MNKLKKKKTQNVFMYSFTIQILYECLLSATNWKNAMYTVMNVTDLANTIGELIVL